MINSQYMDDLLHPKMLVTVINQSRARLTNVEFDTVAFRGNSGVLLGPPIASKLNKQMLLCRKSTESSHSDAIVEGFMCCKRYIIVDDFISSGNTVCEIIKAIKLVYPKAKCIGVLACNTCVDEDEKFGEFMTIAQVKSRIKYMWDTHFPKKTYKLRLKTKREIYKKTYK